VTSNLLLALLSGLLLVLAFPRFDIDWLAAVALAPLLMAAGREPSPWRRILLGEVAGIVYWAGTCYWIQFVLEYHGNMGLAGSWGAFALFCLAKSLHLAAFTWLAGYLLASPHAIISIAALWVGIERTHAPLGFAWLALGNAGINMGLPMRLAPLVGVYGLSFVMAMLNAAMASVLLRHPRRRLGWLALLLVIPLLPALPESGPGREQAVVVQSNVAMEEHFTTASVAETRDELARLSLQAALAPDQPPVRLIIWPEVPLPLYYEQDAEFRRQANLLARAAEAWFLFGTVAFTPEGAPLNSVQLVSPAGEPAGRYDKIYLVPFGEFVPPYFGWVNRITREAGDFAPGRQIVVSPVGGHRLGAFICYESAFPHLVRRFAAAGAEVLVNLSNDGYFGTTAAREQHLLIARMRAAENRRWLVRATNNGITCSIDPLGRIRRQLEPFARLAARLYFDYETALAPYTRYGDWFAWLCLAVSLGAVVLSQWPRYRAGAPHSSTVA
jgi:apolipoprotein N-acyltransferase